jgi:hypothetical protein
MVAQSKNGYHAQLKTEYLIDDMIWNLFGTQKEK